MIFDKSKRFRHDARIIFLLELGYVDFFSLMSPSLQIQNPVCGPDLTTEIPSTVTHV